MGRAELLALVIKVLKLIAPLALALPLLAGTAPDVRARARPLDRDQPAVDFTRLRGCCTDVRTASSVPARGPTGHRKGERAVTLRMLEEVTSGGEQEHGRKRP